MASKRKFNGGDGDDKENQPPKKLKKVKDFCVYLIEHLKRGKNLEQKRIVNAHISPSDLIVDVPKQLVNSKSKHRYSVEELIGSVCMHFSF